MLRGRCLSPRALSNVAHGVAKSAAGMQGAEWAPLWEELAVASTAKVDDLTANELSSMSWSFALASHASDATAALFDEIGRSLLERLEMVRS